MGETTVIRMKCGHGFNIDLNAIAENTQSTLLDFGIIPVGASENTYCINGLSEDTKRCESYLNRDKLRNDLWSHC